LLERNDGSGPLVDDCDSGRDRSLTLEPRRFDITDRRDVARLVNVFYDRVRDDRLLGPIFDDIAHVDWATHLPRMYDFWESVLFGTATFKGTPLAVHRSLAQQAPLTTEAFERWVALFQTTVDDFFTGAVADHAKNSAVRIAATLRSNLTIDTGCR
jgi:hemoglobin